MIKFRLRFGTPQSSRHANLLLQNRCCAHGISDVTYASSRARKSFDYFSSLLFMIPRMTHLGATLSALIDRHWESQRAFARACGVDQATIHHVINGRPCSRENLRLFCTHISESPRDQFAVLLAHLQDEAEASGLDVRRLVLRTHDDVTLGELEFHGDGALKQILARVGAEAQRHKDVRDVLATLAAMIEANAGRAGNVYPFPNDTGVMVAEHKKAPEGRKRLSRPTDSLPRGRSQVDAS